MKPTVSALPCCVSMGSPFSVTSSTRHCRSVPEPSPATRVELSGETLRGRAVDVDDAGHLVVDTGDNVRVVAAGDVVHLR